MKILLLPFLFAVSLAYSAGAGSCTTPNHGTAVTAGSGAFTVTLRPENPAPGDAITVTLAATSGSFRGFLITASVGGANAGVFQSSTAGTQTKNCGAEGNAMTHTSAEAKTNAVFSWKPPTPNTAAGTKVTFNLVVVQTKEVWYQISKEATYGQATVSAVPSPINPNPNSTTTPKPSLVPDPSSFPKPSKAPAVVLAKCDVLRTSCSSTRPANGTLTCGNGCVACNYPVGTNQTLDVCVPLQTATSTLPCYDDLNLPYAAFYARAGVCPVIARISNGKAREITKTCTNAVIKAIGFERATESDCANFKSQLATISGDKGDLSTDPSSTAFDPSLSADAVKALCQNKCFYRQLDGIDGIRKDCSKDSDSDNARDVDSGMGRKNALIGMMCRQNAKQEYCGAVLQKAYGALSATTPNRARFLGRSADLPHHESMHAVRSFVDKSLHAAMRRGPGAIFRGHSAIAAAIAAPARARNGRHFRPLVHFDALQVAPSANSTNTTDCLPPNEFQTRKDGNATCAKCPAMSITKEKNQESCTCIANTYFNSTAPLVCYPCPPNTVSLPGSRECTPVSTPTGMPPLPSVDPNMCMIDAATVKRVLDVQTTVGCCLGEAINYAVDQSIAQLGAATGSLSGDYVKQFREFMRATFKACKIDIEGCISDAKLDGVLPAKFRLRVRKWNAALRDAFKVNFARDIASNLAIDVSRVRIVTLEEKALAARVALQADTELSISAEILGDDSNSDGLAALTASIAKLGKDGFSLANTNFVIESSGGSASLESAPVVDPIIPGTNASPVPASSSSPAASVVASFAAVVLATATALLL